MKIFIVHASAGAGHTKAAEAVYNYLKDGCKASVLKMLDILSETNALFRFNYTWGYSHLIKYFPYLWALAFWVTSNRALRFISRPIAKITNRINTGKFIRDLVAENPDFVISTHFLSSEISARLKRTGKIKAKIITVITDFGVHPYWISPGTDIYVVASSFTKKILLAEKIPENKIIELGIPIDAKFARKYDRKELCRKLNISPDRFTVLIMTGSFGIGPIAQIVDLLYKDAQLVVVCAKNKKLFYELSAKNYPGVFVFGFVDNAHEFMAIADVIVTKPGGLSTSELLAMDLAPIFISPIPGQETENIKALNSFGVGVKADSAKEVERVVLEYKNNPETLKKIKERIKNIKKPFAARGLCNVICKSNCRLSS